MYWVLSNEFVDEDNDAELTGDISLSDDTSFDDGVMLDIFIPKITLTLNNDSRMGNMTDHLSIDEARGLVFSTRLRKVLNNNAVDNIQYFDFDIVSPKSNNVYTDYKIANIVGLVDCVDKNKSDLKYFNSGNIKRIRKLVLDESKIPPELNVFRLSNRSTLTIVHQCVKDAVVNAGITGCVFYKVEEYH